MIRGLVVVLVGLGAAVLIGNHLVGPDLERGAVILLVALAEATIGLVVYLGRLATTRRARPEVDRSPPDGVVPVVALPGLDGLPDSADARLRRYDPGRPVAASASASGRSREAGRPLLGRVAVFSFFLGRDGTSWPAREVARAYKAMERMGLWLEAEALRHGRPLNLELVGTYFAADDPEEEPVELTSALDPYQTILDESDADLAAIRSASRAAARLGFRDLADLIRRAEALADHDATIWFLHPYRAGRSSAILGGRDRYPGVGLAVCYASESSTSMPLVGPPYVDPATLAHELLHLHGATDKYGTSLRSFPGRSVSSRDIMRLDEARLSRLRIDRLTAAEIGWGS